MFVVSFIVTELAFWQAETHMEDMQNQMQQDKLFEKSMQNCRSQYSGQTEGMAQCFAETKMLYGAP